MRYAVHLLNVTKDSPSDMGPAYCYPIGGREVHEFLGTGVLVVIPPKLTIMELALIYNYNSDSGQTSKLSLKIFSV
jgi:hypothetical protein